MTENKKVVFIVGASSGIGLRTANEFLKQGCTVYNGSQKPCTLEGVKNITLDAADNSTISKAVEQIINESGKIDVGVYCAGITFASPAISTHSGEYSHLFAVNLFGAMEFCKLIGNVMKSSGGGRILLVSSLAGVIPVPFEAYYSASKAALNAFAYELNIELNPYNINVISVMPGGVRTPFTRKREISQNARDFEQNMDKAVEELAKIEQQDGLSAVFVAEEIVELAQKKNPPIKHVIGFSNKVSYMLNKILPSKWTLFFVKRRFGQCDQAAQNGMKGHQTIYADSNSEQSNMTDKTNHTHTENDNMKKTHDDEKKQTYLAAKDEQTYSDTAKAEMIYSDTAKTEQIYSDTAKAEQIYSDSDSIEQTYMKAPNTVSSDDPAHQNYINVSAMKDTEKTEAKTKTQIEPSNLTSAEKAYETYLKSNTTADKMGTHPYMKKQSDTHTESDEKSRTIYINDQLLNKDEDKSYKS